MTRRSRIHLSQSLPTMSRLSSYASESDTDSSDEGDMHAPLRSVVAIPTASVHHDLSAGKEVSPRKDIPSPPSSGEWAKRDVSGPLSQPVTPLSTARLLRTSKSILGALWLFLSLVTFLHFNATRQGGGDLVVQHLRGRAGEPIGDFDDAQGDLTTVDGKKRYRPFVRAPPVKVPVPPLLRPNPPHHIPLPLPPNKVSVVLMNHSRPRMVQESSLMRTLLAHPNIDEVVLLHSNPKTAFEFVHPKVVNIDATRQNDEMGLSLRFYFCQLAANDWVIHVDDDMEFMPSTLSELLIEFGKNPRRIVGRFGRNLKPNNSFNGYTSHNAHKDAEVVLTKLMVMERDTCSSFFQYAHVVWDDLVLNNGEGPMWNGEDIFMSLVANHVYGAPEGRFNNYAMDWLDVWNAPDYLKDYDNGKLDISGGMEGIWLWDWHWWQSVLRRNRHYSYRGKLWNTAKRRLSGLQDR